MDCFWCEIESGEIKLLEAEAARWLGKDELDSVEWLPADVRVVEEIREGMEEKIECDGVVEKRLYKLR